MLINKMRCKPNLKTGELHMTALGKNPSMVTHQCQIAWLSWTVECNSWLLEAEQLNCSFNTLTILKCWWMLYVLKGRHIWIEFAFINARQKFWIFSRPQVPLRQIYTSLSTTDIGLAQIHLWLHVQLSFNFMHAVQWSDRYWAGLVTEQVTMWSMKSIGGPSHSWGMNDIGWLV